MDSLRLSSGAAVIAIDGSMRVFEWSEASAELFGIPRESAIGRQCFELLEGRDVHANPYCCAQCPVVQARSRGVPIRPFAIEARHRIEGTIDVRLYPVSLSPEAHLYVAVGSPMARDSEAPPRSSAHPPAESIPSPSLLTSREMEVLVRLGRGATTGELAEALGISAHTVRNHVQRVLQKLGAHSRVEALAIARSWALL